MDDKKTPVAQEVAAAPVKETKKGKGAIIAIVVLALLLCASLGANAYQALNKGEEKQEATNSETNTKPSEEKLEADEKPSQEKPVEVANKGYDQEKPLGAAEATGYSYNGPSVFGSGMTAYYNGKSLDFKLSYSSSMYLYNDEYQGTYDKSVMMHVSEPIYGLYTASWGQAFSPKGVAIVAVFSNGRVGMLTMEDIIKNGKTEIKPMEGIEGVVAISNSGVGDSEGITGWNSTIAVRADGSFYDLFEEYNK